MESENDRSRLLHVLGKKTNERVVPVAEKTDVVEINGFIFRPEHSRKTRGDQHWFVNRRTVRSPYLHRAVQDAFDGLVPEGNHPAYVLHLTVDPARIDVNVHPAKTEIKFDDERAVYAVVRSAVKHALGQHQVAPALDFESMQAFQTPILQPNAPRPLPPALDINPNFNPFAPANGGADEPSFVRSAGFQHRIPPHAPFGTTVVLGRSRGSGPLRTIGTTATSQFCPFAANQWELRMGNPLERPLPHGP